jgi:hypothetical protein
MFIHILPALYLSLRFIAPVDEEEKNVYAMMPRGTNIQSTPLVSCQILASFGYEKPTPNKLGLNAQFWHFFKNILNLTSNPQPIARRSLKLQLVG